VWPSRHVGGGGLWGWKSGANNSNDQPLLQLKSLGEGSGKKQIASAERMKGQKRLLKAQWVEGGKLCLGVRDLGERATKKVSHSELPVEKVVEAKGGRGVDLFGQRERAMKPPARANFSVRDKKLDRAQG